MKIYIITDLEGVGGVVSPNQIMGNSAAYEKARLLLTSEVNAAIDGALNGGASEIIVLDGHGANSAYNLVTEELHDRASYIVGSPWKKYLPELDETCDALFLIGAHAMSGTPDAVLEHTMDSSSWVEMRINGKPMGEIGLEAAIAGHYGVPTVLVSGDKAVCTEALELLGKVETAQVKQAVSRTSAKIMSPRMSCSLIREKAEAAIKHIGDFIPYKVSGPVEIQIKKHRVMPPISEHISGVKVVDPTTVSATGADVIEAWDRIACVI